MKIEKLTENKIRIILNLDDLEKKNIDLQSLMSNSSESQTLFVDILDEAEKEVGFVTKDCKILIEAIASSEGVFVFTITKFASQNNIDTSKKKKVKFRRKIANISSDKCIYSFNNFEEFCNLCEGLNNNFINSLNTICKNISLYLFNGTYYLILNNINTDFYNLSGFYATISEFAKLVNHSNSFEAKIKEHGKVIFKNNAIKKGILYFS